jgi:hypothetical protein
MTRAMHAAQVEQFGQPRGGGDGEVAFRTIASWERPSHWYRGVSELYERLLTGNAVDSQEPVIRDRQQSLLMQIFP